MQNHIPYIKIATSIEVGQNPSPDRKVQTLFEPSHDLDGWMEVNINVLVKKLDWESIMETVINSATRPTNKLV